MRDHAFVLLCSLWAAGSLPAADYYVGPRGRAHALGTQEAPWDLGSALADGQGITAGDTIYLLEGTYRKRPSELFEVRLQGTAEHPIHVRPAPGQHAKIDGGLSIQSPATHVWIRDLEVFVSEPLPEKPVSAGSHPRDLNRPHGGLHMYGGRDCKYINLVVHHCNQGISCWKDEIAPEIYGCILFGNGWRGEDRGHGHCLYTQNHEGVKTISNCIMTCPYEGSYTVHAYGSDRAYVDNYLLTENIGYGKGPFLVGGGRPSHGIRVLRNYLYGIDVKIGYSAPYNEDCEIRDNVVVRGKIETARYRTVTWKDNVIVPSGDLSRAGRIAPVLLPNKYDLNRAHLVIFEWDGTDAVEVQTDGFLDDGDTAELFHPEDPFGFPAAEVVCRNGAIRVAARGEFTVFLVKARRR